MEVGEWSFLDGICGSTRTNRSPSLYTEVCSNSPEVSEEGWYINKSEKQKVRYYTQTRSQVGCIRYLTLIVKKSIHFSWLLLSVYSVLERLQFLKVNEHCQRFLALKGHRIFESSAHIQNIGRVGFNDTTDGKGSLPHHIIMLQNTHILPSFNPY